MAVLPKFKNRKFLELAFTHRSYLNEINNQGLISNERLEFLGDSVLAFLVSKFLYQKFPTLSEGKLTDLRSILVRTDTLATVAHELELGKHLKLSRGEEKFGRNNPTLLANTFEAFVGALFLDSGLDSVWLFLEKTLLPRIEKENVLAQLKDNKSLFQEFIQQQKKPAPIYQILKTKGPDHKKIFTVGVYVLGNLEATGEGNSRQIAEQQAAKLALEKLKKR